ncbi:MAG TPA: outer membrane lipoprotein chaperone LolA [Burkholderiaceae bacterium]|nr:outer membrane lipoprotein chaperone LolA [Burkholderiaceae bacterium]
MSWRALGGYGRVALACALFAFGVGSARAAALDQLRSFLTQTTSARGEFVQRVIRSNATQQSSGRFAFQRPGKFRWIYEKPYEQLIVADGQRLTLFDRDLNQATVRKLQSALPSSPASILFGSNDFEREFEVSDAGARDGLEWVLARPRMKDTPFERIEIGFRDGLPGAMQLVDSFGNTTRLTFSNVERNPKLGADTFSFTPPKGADVLTE